MLRSDEAQLIKAMTRNNARAAEFVRDLENVRVRPMSDGGMGSLQFASDRCEGRVFGAKIAEAEFKDADGVLVSVTLNVDNFGDVFELDIWKVDFSPLERIPVPDEITVRVEPLN